VEGATWLLFLTDEGTLSSGPPQWTDSVDGIWRKLRRLIAREPSPHGDRRLKAPRRLPLNAKLLVAETASYPTGAVF